MWTTQQNLLCEVQKPQTPDISVVAIRVLSYVNCTTQVTNHKHLASLHVITVRSVLFPHCFHFSI